MMRQKLRWTNNLLCILKTATRTDPCRDFCNCCLCLLLRSIISPICKVQIHSFQILVLSYCQKLINTIFYNMNIFIVLVCMLCNSQYGTHFLFSLLWNIDMMFIKNEYSFSP